MWVVLFVLTVLGSVGALGLAVWPGVLEEVVIGCPHICCVVPLLAGYFLVLCLGTLWNLIRIGLRWWNRERLSAISGRGAVWALAALGILGVTVGLLWFHVPQRLAFARCWEELQALVDDAPTDAFRDEMLGRQVGPYWVERYGADSRGGVYFRTFSGPDGIGPDTMSYGFAFRPNEEGTPFGNAHYRVHPLFGDWYVFQASNDW